jgi:hypothetical protein
MNMLSLPCIDSAALKNSEHNSCVCRHMCSLPDDAQEVELPVPCRLDPLISRVIHIKPLFSKSFLNSW